MSEQLRRALEAAARLARHRELPGATPDEIVAAVEQAAGCEVVAAWERKAVVEAYDEAWVLDYDALDV